jgi:hypothetical protein
LELSEWSYYYQNSNSNEYIIILYLLHLQSIFTFDYKLDLQKLLNNDNSNIKIKTFHLIYYTTFKSKILCNAALSSIFKRNEETILRIELFDLKLGHKNLSKDIE